MAAPTLLRAEYYRYIDKTGAVRYTDNLLAVPEAQRPIVKKYIGRNEISEDAIPVIASPEDGVEKDGVEKKTEQINLDDSKQLELSQVCRVYGLRRPLNGLTKIFGRTRIAESESKIRRMCCTA